MPERNFFLMATSDAERNEWVAAIGRATTESRRVRSYSEEVEYQEQQQRLAAIGVVSEARTLVELLGDAEMTPPPLG